MKRRTAENIFSWNNLLYLFALVIALWLSWNTIKVIERNYSLEQEVGTLAEEVSILALENERLKFNIEYYKTTDYLEVAAKESLNKRSAGESVAVFERDEFTPKETSLSANSSPDNEQAPDYQENLDAWWNFLFNSGD